MKCLLLLILFPAFASAQVHHYRSYERSETPIADTAKPTVWIADSSDITMDTGNGLFVVDGPSPDRLRILKEVKHKKLPDSDEFDFNVVDDFNNNCTLVVTVYSKNGNAYAMATIDSPTSRTRYHYRISGR